MDTNQNTSDFDEAAYSNKNSNLRCVEEIPPPYNQMFAKYETFNDLQSQVFDEVFYTDNPLIISAPTGSGKTVIFELAIARILTNIKYSNGDPLFKAVYVAPMKALCEERMLDWHSRFNEFGINCISVTGDSDIFDCKSLMNHNLIITTPEKWDVITRKWKDNKSLVEAVKLFMIDEIHLLNEDTRGPTLEAVVSRMKIIANYIGSSHSGLRFIALSATIPNAEDIAEWFDQCSTNPAKCFRFSDDIRPVKLTKVVLGYPFNPLHSTPFKFDIMLNYKLQPVLLKYAQGKPVLIFCSTRKSVEMTAKHLMLNITVELSPEQRNTLEQAASTISDNNVRSLLIHGIACHHAGMLPENKKAVENLFREGHLPILVATSTLAMGVNLPAHLVIIKTTKQYVNGEYKSYSESAILQMIGRAGRSGFDTNAYAVIMTTVEEKEKYENMVGGSQCVESNLHLHLTEHLNSEVVLGTISDLPVAMEWLTSTFFYIRAKKHPRQYGLPNGLTSDQLDKKLIEMCQIEINKLAKAGMLTIDETTSITPMLLGYLMAKYYLAFDTIKLFKEINGSEILPQMLNLISNCKEFSDLYLRVNDKKALNLLNKCRNKETIRFPLSGRIKTLGMKINCLIQAVFGCLEVLEHSLQNDAEKIMRSGERISKCLLDYLESSDFIEYHPKAYSALLSANILAKCFHTRLWENSKHVAKQLPGIGIALSSHLVSAGKTSFEDIFESNPRDLERILGRKPPQGNNIQELIAHLPKYVLQVFSEKTENGTIIKFSITLTNATDIQIKCTLDKNSYMVLLVGDSFNNIYFYEKYSHDYMIENGEIQKQFESFSPEKHEIAIHFISQTWVGIDCTEKLLLNSKQETHKTENLAKNKQKKLEADNDTTKKPPITIQQFIDAYMKKSKPISKRTDLTKNASNQSSTSEVKESCISEVTSDKKIGSNDGPDSYNEVSESESELLEEEHVSADAESNINVDEKVVEKPREADNAEQEEEEDDKIVFDIMDELYDDVEPIHNVELIDNVEPIVVEKNTSTNLLNTQGNKNTVYCEAVQQNKNIKNLEDHFEEDFFKDDEDFNKFCKRNQYEQSQPDSTSCEHLINNQSFQQSTLTSSNQVPSSTKSKISSDFNQKTISWRSPLITSPVLNYHSPVFEKSSEDEKEASKPDDYINKRYQEKRQSPTDFSIKLLNDSYIEPSTKPQSVTQIGARKKNIFKFQLTDKLFQPQTESQQPSDKFLEDYNLSTANTLPEQNFHYHTIKVIDRKTQKPSPDYTVPTSNNLLIRNENVNSVGFKPTNEYRLKNFMEQFRKEEKKKLNVTSNRVSSTQPVGSKWNRFLYDVENYEEMPSCSKWHEYLPRDEDSYKPPPSKRSSLMLFDSPPSNKQALNESITTSNFADLGLNKEQSTYSKLSPLSNFKKERTTRPYQRPNFSPRRTQHFAFAKENNPFVNFVASPGPSQFRQPYFVPASQNYLPPSVFNPHMPSNYQYFSQPPMQYLPPPPTPPPPLPLSNCTHCNCCKSVYYNYPQESDPYIPCSRLHSAPDEQHYAEHF